MKLQLHDVSAFPFVELISAACKPGFAAQWCAEMDELVANNQLFVVAFDPHAIDETAEDFRTRGIWFKRNRAQLPGRCAAMLAILASAEERASSTAEMEKRSRGFGVVYRGMASFAAAKEAAPEFIRAVQKELSA